MPSLGRNNKLQTCLNVKFVKTILYDEVLTNFSRQDNWEWKWTTTDLIIFNNNGNFNGKYVSRENSRLLCLLIYIFLQTSRF